MSALVKYMSVARKLRDNISRNAYDSTRALPSIRTLAAGYGVDQRIMAKAIDPTLTSVCYGETQMANLALTLNAGPEPDTASIVRIDPKLIVRASTAGGKG